MMAAEIILSVFILFYTVEELIELATLRSKYFKSFFNNADYVVIIILGKDRAGFFKVVSDLL